MKRYRLSAVVVAGLGLMTMAQAASADAERGRLLYENHCIHCHESVVHIREDRKVGSVDELRQQIQRWQGVLTLGWQEVEIEDVLEYLNGQYYKLPGTEAAR